MHKTHEKKGEKIIKETSSQGEKKLQYKPFKVLKLIER